MANPNLQMLTNAARLLEPILGELLFVGGCTTALLITDKAAADVRPTFDVDAIAEITSAPDARASAVTARAPAQVAVAL
jgi:hypothetical protein